MHKLLPLFLLLLSAGAFCQQAYRDTLLQYQHQYKKDLAAIIREDTAYVRFYAPDAAFRVKAQVERLRDQPVFSMRTSSGVSRQARKALQVNFKLRGKEYHLFGYQLLSLLSQEAHKESFFIPFFDETSGAETYGGGRYLDFEMTDLVQDTLVLDFNKAYNPYCAFVTGYNCPTPPPENAVPAAIRAGEKNYAKKTH